MPTKNGTSAEIFSGDAARYRRALEWAVEDGADTKRHRVLAAAFAVAECEDPAELLNRLLRLQGLSAGWAEELEAERMPATGTEAA